MLIWRPVIEGYDTLSNVKYVWTLRDLADAHEILDIVHAEQSKQADEIRRSRS